MFNIYSVPESKENAHFEKHTLVWDIVETVRQITA